MWPLFWFLALLLVLALLLLNPGDGPENYVREYGVEINFILLEAQTLAKKRFSFKDFFIAPSSLFSNSSIPSRYLFVMTCIVTVQSQLCGALTFSSMISLYLAVE